MSKSLAPTQTSPSSQKTTETAQNPVTSVVLPTYNESGNVEQLVRELRAVFADEEMRRYRPVEFIWVDGGSDDGTRRIIRELCADDESMHAVFLRRRFGQSPALAAGFHRASGEIIIPMDADLQNDPHDIPMLLDELEKGYDAVSGWRRDRHDPWHKTIPSAIQTRLAKLTGPEINDFGCTMKAYRREALEEIDLYGEGHRYLPSKLHKLGYSITEREVNHRPREHGESRYGAGRLVRGFVDLLFQVFWVRYSTRPLHVFGGTGIASLGAGVALGLWMVLANFFLGTELLPNLPQLLLSVGLVLFGLQLFVFGVIAEFLTKLYYRDDVEYRIAETV